ncbi:MAG: hypothetical protein L3K13_05075 [Thermoplasmata archaeon]|nr:hypothetical protein [Thermoplasmata archaeon]
MNPFPEPRKTLGAVTVLLLLLLVGLAVAPFGTTGHAAPAPARVLTVQPAAASTPRAAAAPLANPSGFFTSSTLPVAPLANRTCLLAGVGTSCPSGYLLNVTNDVAMNYSSKGLLAVAYTSFSNEVACPAAAPYAASVVSVLFSTNNGSTWSAPQYHSNPDCASAGTFPSAWQPALTSLSNGTLVLAYVEYNSSSVLPFFSSYSPPLTRLVLTESYDAGGHWTLPTVLNSSVVPTLTGVEFPELSPSLSAVGRTIYLSWWTLAVYNGFGGSSTTSHVALLVSTNGGRFWSPVLTLADLYYANAENPYVLATPSGTVYVAYTTGLPGYATVLVDNSSDNFTSFATNVVAYSVSPIPLMGAFSAPAPRLAYAAGAGVLYVGFVGGVPNTYGRLFAAPSLYYSTNGGTSWTASLAIGKLFFDPLKTIRTGGYSNPYSNTGVYDLELAVTPNGTLELEALYQNGTLCWQGSCGFQGAYAASTANKGGSFSGPFELNGTMSPNPTAWPGEHGALVAAGTHLWLASALESCPFAPSSHCGVYPNRPIPTTELLLAEPATSAGLTATFRASGLNSTTAWDVDLMGHVAVGTGTSTLQFNGIPPGEPLFWSVTGLNVTSTLREYVSSQSTYPVLSPTANLSDLVTFAAYVPVTEDASPANLFQRSLPPGCAQFFQYYNSFDATINCANVNLTPYAPGPSHWVEAGVALTMNASIWDPLVADCLSHTGSTYVYCSISITNFTFISWSGTGAGSVNSSGPNITFRPLGAVTEVANFLETGDCSGYYQQYNGHAYNFVNCARFTVPVGFSEKGLPAGTPWGVTLSGPDGNFTNVSSGQGVIFPSVPTAAAFAVTLWTVPSATPGLYWIGNSSQGDTVVTPVLGPITVTYSLATLTGKSFPVTVSELGLPRGLEWSYTVSTAGGANAQSYGVNGTSAVLSLTGGVSYTLNASFLPTTTGSGYSANVVSYGVATVNQSYAVNVSAPAVLNLSGAGNVTFAFGLAWWVDVASSPGGSVTPTSRWVANGSGILLTATAAPNQEFVGWTGVGPGSSTPSQRHTNPLLLRPSGPIRELATFAPRPPPSFSLVVNASGLPATEPFTVQLGTRAYSGVGGFTIRNLSGAGYAVGVPYTYSNDSLGVRYLPTGTSSSLPLSGGVLSVFANGSLAVSFSTEYLLNVLATPGGTVSPSGASWVGAGAQVNVGAVAGIGYRFLGWNGTGTGARSGTTASFVLVLGGPVSETAEFLRLPPPAPLTYTLHIDETGLPGNTGWNLSVGNLSAGGPSRTFAVPGLNGTYQVLVPVVTTSAGVRFVPSNAGVYPVDLTHADSNLTVQFTEQVLLTVSVSGAGSATPASKWVGANTPVVLAATPSLGSVFLGWSGNGSGSYAGLATGPTITPTGPVEEVATFGPAPAAASSGSSSAGRTNALLLWGAAAAVAVAAVVAVALLSRRQAPPAPDAEPSAEPGMEPESVPEEPPEGWEPGPGEPGPPEA